jgi:hypothetical protein
LRRFLKIAGIGCGGLIALVVVLVIVGALIGGQNTSQQGSQSSSSSSDNQPSSSSKQSKEPTASIGEPVQAGKAQWTVTNAYRTNQLTNNFGQQPKQGNFVVVDFTFKNNGDKPVTLDTTSLSLIDSQGRSSNAAPDVSGYITQDKRIFLEQVNPGVSKDGEAIFSVSAEAEGFKLDAGDTNPFTNEDAYVELNNV